MADEKPKAPATKAKPDTTEPGEQPDLKPSDAEAPGPITPEHESGSWEQTQEEREGK